MQSTNALAQSSLWQTPTRSLSSNQQTALTYQRAKSIIDHFQLDFNDVLTTSPRYWRMQSDPILAMDVNVWKLIATHYTLCTGTLASSSVNRPDLRIIVDKLLKFELSGQFCLTEAEHGSDLTRTETTATMLSDVFFELNTPTRRAAKMMTVATPRGLPVVAIVFARLIVGGEDRGPKPFIVRINDGFGVLRGIHLHTPPQILASGNSSLTDHTLVSFDSLHIPSTALLGSLTKSRHAQTRFPPSMQRLVSASLSMGAVSTSVLRLSAFTAGKHSLQRELNISSSRVARPLIPVLNAQDIPALVSIAHAAVTQAYSNATFRLCSQAKGRPVYQRFLAAVFRINAMESTTRAAAVLGDRYGAQSMAEIREVLTPRLDSRRSYHAEFNHDVLGLSLHDFMEDLISGQLTAPPASDPTSPLSRHEAAMLTELRSTYSSTTTSSLSQKQPHTRTPSPHTRATLLPLIKATGHRLAYESALASSTIDARLIELYVSSVIQDDAAWYSENLGISRGEQVERVERWAAALVPDLEGLVERLDGEGYSVASCLGGGGVHEDRWEGGVGMDRNKAVRTTDEFVSGHSEIFYQSHL